MILSCSSIGSEVRVCIVDGKGDNWWRCVGGGGVVVWLRGVWLMLGRSVVDVVLEFGSDMRRKRFRLR